MKKLTLVLFASLLITKSFSQGFTNSGGNGHDVLISKTSDSLVIEGKYVGIINTLKLATSGVTGTETYFEYQISLDEFPIDNLKDKIAAKLGVHFDAVSYVERFKDKTKSQISGYYLIRASQLKNGRTNWALAGVAIPTAVLIFPNAAVLTVTVLGINVLSGAVVITSVVAIVKEYKANKMLKKAGRLLIE